MQPAASKRCCRGTARPLLPQLSENKPRAGGRGLWSAYGARIRAERKARNSSQDTLVLACNIDRSYMGRIERGEVNITIQKLYVIADVLVCAPYVLLPEAKHAANEHG